MIVVTGTPRSGTSLAMRAIEAAGVPAFHDDRIEPDSANPHGYYEHSSVYEWKPGWMEAAEGMVVKVPLFQLHRLPDNVELVVTQRSEESVRASMRSAFGGSGDEVFQHRMYAMRHIELNCRHVIADFDAVIAGGFSEVAGFLGLDAALMDSVIDPSLRRF